MASGTHLHGKTLFCMGYLLLAACVEDAPQQVPGGGTCQAAGSSRDDVDAGAGFRRLRADRISLPVLADAAVVDRADASTSAPDEIVDAGTEHDLPPAEDAGFV